MYDESVRVTAMLVWGDGGVFVVSAGQVVHVLCTAQLTCYG